MNTDLSTPEGRLNYHCFAFLRELNEDGIVGLVRLNQLDNAVERLARFVKDAQPIVKELEK